MTETITLPQIAQLEAALAACTNKEADRVHAAAAAGGHYTHAQYDRDVALARVYAKQQLIDMDLANKQAQVDAQRKLLESGAGKGAAWTWEHTNKQYTLCVELVTLLHMSIDHSQKL